MPEHRGLLLHRLLPVPLPYAITGKQGRNRTNCYAIPSYLRPLKSANTRRRVPVVGQNSIGPDKDMITDYCVGQNVDPALQASLIAEMVLPSVIIALPMTTWLPIRVFSWIITLCPL